MEKEQFDSVLYMKYLRELKMELKVILSHLRDDELSVVRRITLPELIGATDFCQSAFNLMGYRFNRLSHISAVLLNIDTGSVAVIERKVKRLITCVDSFVSQDQRGICA